MNTNDIIREWLLANCYDGLCNEDCGCSVDDLAPCECLNLFRCVAAVHVPCPGAGCLMCGGEEGDCPGYYAPRGARKREENA